ncbi:hypothetical protein C0056_18400 [Pseudomonas aeruginosa]|nr:hypothetical protein C0056_18400 [Pseudomonas aeruginosa]
MIGWDDLHARASIGTVWRRSDDERARAALLRQYGAIIESWATEQGGWDGFGTVLRQALEGIPHQVHV